MAFNPDPNVDREGRARRLADSRLSLPTPLRLALATSSSFLVGLGLGLSHGAQSAGFVFRAENAHRLPATPTGWFLYHKSKNYNMALAGVREGVKMGGKLAFWVGLFFAVEDGWDQCRDVKDVANTVLASATVAGAFSAWNRFPVTTAARTAKTGLAVGLIYGLTQDAVGALRGRTPGYVNWVRGKAAAAEEEEEKEVGAAAA